LSLALVPRVALTKNLILIRPQLFVDGPFRRLPLN